MYNNIGKKIKALAVISFAIIAFGTFVAGCVCVGLGYNKILIRNGLLIMSIGPLVSWISSWMLYAFGELVDKVCAIEKKLNGEPVAPAKESTPPLD